MTMRLKVVATCLVAAIVSINLYSIKNPPQEVAADRQLPEPGSASAVAREPTEPRPFELQHFANTPIPEPVSVAAGVPEAEPERAAEGPRQITVSLDAGESDPGIIAVAREVGVTPGCIVEELRAQVELLEYMETNPQFDPIHDHYEYANPVSEQCKQESRGRSRSKAPPEYDVGNPTYEQYSNEELEALAPYDPDAAILLARRTEDDRTSRRYYELATQVTQDARPLNEWLLRRGTIEHNDNVLNVEPARLGYETALIAEAFGSDLNNLREMFREALVEGGVDLVPVEASANERIAELKGNR